MTALGLLSGCLVTDPIEFERPANSPPQFALNRSAEVQQGSIKYILASSGTPSWKFNFRVRDLDVDQDLEVHWRIYSGSAPGNREPTIVLPADGSEVRDLPISVQRGMLKTDSCHRVEIGVSSSFTKFDEEDISPATFDLRSDTFDYDLFTFWIWEGSPTANDPAKLVETCAAQPFEAVPIVVEGAAGTAGDEQP